MKALLVTSIAIFLCSNLYAQTSGRKVSLKDLFGDTTSSTKPLLADIVDKIKIVHDYGGGDEGWRPLDDSLKAYIKSNGFVPLFQKDALPDTIQTYYNLIMDSINQQHAELANWYVKLSSVRDNYNHFYFAIYSLSAIASDRVMRKKIEAEQEKIRLENDTSKIKHFLMNDYMGPPGYILSYAKLTHSLRLIKSPF